MMIQVIYKEELNSMEEKKIQQKSLGDLATVCTYCGEPVQDSQQIVHDRTGVFTYHQPCKEREDRRFK